MSDLKETARKMLADLSLTEDDKKRFSPRGSLASQLEKSIGEVMLVIGTTTKETKNGAELTVLQLAQSKVQSERADLTPAYDMQNIFLSSDKDTSLYDIGVGNEGRNALSQLAVFQVDDITDTGKFPFKFSRAAQELDIEIDATDIDWVKLRAKYNKDEKFQVARDDADRDISWLEIRHIFISPVTK